ncbi:AidA/PixA family protein [Azospirillum argentinense]
MTALPSPIDILLVVDTDALLERVSKQETTLENPMVVDPGLTFAIVRERYGDPARSTGALRLTWEADAELRLRVVGLGGHGEEYVLPYAIDPLGKGQKVLAFRKAKTRSVHSPLPDPQAPEKPGFQKISQSFWSGRVRREGRAEFEVLFMLADRSGAVQGYCRLPTTLTFAASGTGNGAAGDGEADHG